MIERHSVGRPIAHVVLVLGVLFVAFPIYYTLTGSTLTSPQIIAPPMPLVPGNRGTRRTTPRR